MRLESIGRYADWAPVLLRVALGLILIVHGYDKLYVTGVSNVAAFFSSVHVPLPAIAAWIAGFVEFFGGILILVGLLTRIVAFLVSIEFLIILYLKIVSWKVPLVDFKTGVGGYQLDLLIFAVALALFLRGAGIKLSLDKVVFK